MKAKDNNTSTEKLLKLIRGDKAPSPPSGSNAKGTPSKGAPKTPRVKNNFFDLSPNLLPFGKNMTVGVDIGASELRLVKVSASESRMRLLEFRQISFPDRAQPGSPAFPDFLHAALKNFCGSPKNIDVWTLVSAVKVDILRLYLPKAAKKQIATAVFWAAKKEKGFDEKETILDFEIRGEVTEKGNQKIEVLAYIVPTKNLNQVREYFARAGYKLTGATISPFTVQNIFRAKWIPNLTPTFGHLFIGRDWSRIDIFSGENLVLSRGIRTGINSMAEALSEGYNLLNLGASASFSTEDAHDGPAEDSVLFLEPGGAPAESVETSPSDSETDDPRNPLSRDRAKTLLMAKLMGHAAPSNIPGAELSESDIVEMIEPALERLAKQIDRTFQHFSLTLGNPPVEKIYVSGPVGCNSRVSDFLKSQLGIKKESLDVLNPNIPGASAIVVPQALGQRDAFTAALGLALSDNSRTPNLLFTHKDREKAKEVAFMNKVFYAGFAVVFLIMAAIGAWKFSLVGQRQAKLDQLTYRLSQHQPIVDEKLLLETAEAAKKKNELIKVFSQRFEGVAVIGEITALTPANVRFLDLKVHLGPVPEGLSQDAPKEKTKKEPVVKTVTIDGIVVGDPTAFDAELSEFLAKIKNSPVLGTPSVSKSAVEPFVGEGDVLHFLIEIKLT